MPDTAPIAARTAGHCGHGAVTIFAFDRRGTGVAVPARLAWSIHFIIIADGQFERDATLALGIAGKGLVGADGDRSSFCGESQLETLHPRFGIFFIFKHRAARILELRALHAFAFQTPHDHF